MDCGGGLGPGRGRDGHGFASCPPPGVGGEHASPQRSRGPRTPGHCLVLAWSWGLRPAGQLPRPPWEGVLWQGPRTRLMPLRPGAWCSGSWRRGPHGQRAGPRGAARAPRGPELDPGLGWGQHLPGQGRWPPAAGLQLQNAALLRPLGGASQSVRATHALRGRRQLREVEGPGWAWVSQERAPWRVGDRGSGWEGVSGLCSRPSPRAPSVV